MTQPGSRLVLLPFVAACTLAGCQHRSPSETATDWIHGISGGEIYTLRPPPPGYDAPYPHVGRTPTTNPEFPTSEARKALTGRLESQRNGAQRLSAATGALPGRAMFGPPPPPANGNSLTLTSTTPSPSSKQDPRLTSQKDIAGQPKVIYLPIDHSLPKTLPVVPSPPAPITFPDFVIPASAATIIPDLDTRTPPGVLFRFESATDHLTDGQEESFAKILRERKDRPLTLRGFGVTLDAKAGLHPEEQEHEIALGLLRARALARAFIARGVPSSAILLRADAIGDGVRVTY